MTTNDDSTPAERAAALRTSAARFLAEAERLEREAQEEKARRVRLRTPMMPGVNYGEHKVVLFERRLPYAGGTRDYTYAAVLYRTSNAGNLGIVITDRTSRTASRYATWESLLTFVGEDNWHTLREVTVTTPLRTEGGYAVNDLGHMADNAIADSTIRSPFDRR